MPVLLVKLLFDHYLQQVGKQKNKAKNMDILGNIEILARSKKKKKMFKMYLQLYNVS